MPPTFHAVLWLVVLGCFGPASVRADANAVAVALDLPAGTAVTFDGDPWSAQTAITHDGVDAAQSDLTGNGSPSQLSFVVTGPLNLSFFWKLDPAGSYVPSLSFLIDQVEQAYLGQGHPAGDWAQKTYTIPAGPHTLTWEHNDLEGVLLSKAWLDQIVLAPVVFHSVTFDLGAYGIRTGGGALTQRVEAGSAALPPTFSITSGWIFTGWDTSFGAVVSDMTVNARYQTVVAAWAGSFDLAGPDAVPTADPDGDGTPNLLEYVFATSPVLAHGSTASGPTLTTGTIPAGGPGDGEQAAVVLTHRRLKGAAANIVYQSSSNLADPGAWTPVMVTPVVVDPDADGDGLVETVAVSVPLPAGADPRLFLRLSVTVAE